LTRVTAGGTAQVDVAMPEELRFMLRSAFYSTFVGIAYWLLTREPAGTILLLGSGLAAAVMFSPLLYEWRRSGHRLNWSDRALGAAARGGR